MGTMGKVRKSHPVGRSGHTGPSNGHAAEEAGADHTALSAYIQRFSRASVLVIGDLVFFLSVIGFALFSTSVILRSLRTN